MLGNTVLKPHRVFEIHKKEREYRKVLFAITKLML